MLTFEPVETKILQGKINISDLFQWWHDKWPTYLLSALLCYLTAALDSWQPLGDEHSAVALGPL